METPHFFDCMWSLSIYRDRDHIGLNFWFHHETLGKMNISRLIVKNTQLSRHNANIACLIAIYLTAFLCFFVRSYTPDYQRNGHIFINSFCWCRCVNITLALIVSALHPTKRTITTKKSACLSTTDFIYALLWTCKLLPCSLMSADENA